MWLRLSALVAKVDLPRAGIGNHFGTVALDDHLAEMQERDAFGEFQRHIHVMLDHHDGDIARDSQQQLFYVPALVDRKPANGSSSSSTFGFCVNAIAISTRRRSP